MTERRRDREEERRGEDDTDLLGAGARRSRPREEAAPLGEDRPRRRGQRAAQGGALGLMGTALLVLVVVGLVLIWPDTGGLAAYENRQLGYTIDYPRGWSIDEDAPERVVIEPDERNGQMLVQVIELDDEYSLSELADLALDASRDRMDDVEEVDQRTIEIRSGQRGRVIEMTYDNPNDRGGILRSKLLLVPLGSTVFQVEVALLDADWDDTFDDRAERILRSLEIQE